MRVLVIGGTGFIGSYVVSKLNQTVDEVYVLHRAEPTENFLPESNQLSATAPSRKNSAAP